MIAGSDVEIAGQDVINHAGAAALRIIADRTGLTSGLCRALARRGFVFVHDRGRVLADTAVLIADGGRVLSNLAALRDQAALFAPGGLGSDAVACAVTDRPDPAAQDRPGARKGSGSMCGR